MTTPADTSDDVVYVPIPFGLVGQWLQFERWKKDDSSFGNDLRTGLNDWDGRWSMLHWLTESVVDDHAVASQTPRNYMMDVNLEYHLTFWFLSARLCYDTIAYLTVQMAADRDRGKLSAVSFNDLSKSKVQAAFQDVTKNLLNIVSDGRQVFEELKSIRDSLVHFVGQSGSKIEAPKRISIDIPNEKGVMFTVEHSRFADMYGSVEKWPVAETLTKHFRCIYELAGRLECCFLDHVATEKLPGAYRYLYRSMYEFLKVEQIDDFSQTKWVKTAADC